jgi:hypothetical protein
MAMPNRRELSSLGWAMLDQLRKQGRVWDGDCVSKSGKRRLARETAMITQADARRMQERRGIAVRVAPSKWGGWILRDANGDAVLDEYGVAYRFPSESDAQVGLSTFVVE